MAPADGGAGAAERMKARAARLRNLAPVLKVMAEVIHKETDDAFDQSRTVDGKAFQKLAPSTLEARGRRLKGGRSKSRKAGQKGRLTPGAVAKRAAAAGTHKPLIDTGRARNSQRTTLAGKNTLRWSAVGYLGPHMTGTKRVPQRNPTVFNVDRSGKPTLNPRLGARIVSAIHLYVETGKVA